jgi:ATP-dependent Lon protease
VTQILFLGVSLPVNRAWADALEKRFQTFLARFIEHRSAKHKPDCDASDGLAPAATKTSNSDADSDLRYYLGNDHRAMIRRRVERIVERINTRSGASHLKEDQTKRLRPVTDGVTLVPVSSAHDADVIAAALHADFPWLAPATNAVWDALRRSATEDLQGARIPPLLLNGPPGIGKSTWARRLGDLIGVPTGIVEATSEPAGFAVSGLQKGWHGDASGKPLDLILRTRIANPVFVIDEIEKAGHATSSNGRSFDLASALLPLLETQSSRAWQCPYFQVPFDMSWISWILTSNDTVPLSAPLRSRVQIIDLPALTSGQLMGFVERDAAPRGLSDLSIEVALTVLAGACATSRDVPSLRTALRVLDRAQALESRPWLH